MFGAWALKELYQSFIGSRAETLKSVKETEKRAIILEAKLEAATDLIKKLEIKVEKLSTVRAYRN